MLKTTMSITVTILKNKCLAFETKINTDTPINYALFKECNKLLHLNSGNLCSYLQGTLACQKTYDDNLELAKES